MGFSSRNARRWIGGIVVLALSGSRIGARAADPGWDAPRVAPGQSARVTPALARSFRRAAASLQSRLGPEAAAFAAQRALATDDLGPAIVAAAIDRDGTLALAAARIDGSDSPADRAALRLLGVALAAPVSLAAEPTSPAATVAAELPAASNGHGRVAYWQRRGPHRELWMAGPRLTDPRLVLLSEEADGQEYPGRVMAWSPTGDRLAARAIRRGRAQIFVVDAEGQALACVTPPRTVEVDPCWSPDGRWLACLQVDPAGAHAWLVRPDGSERVPVALDPPVVDLAEDAPNLVWEPGAQRPRVRVDATS